MAWTLAGTSSAGKQPLAVINELRAALVERAAAVSYTLPSALQSTISGGVQLGPILGNVQTAVTALIPLFVNHTDSSGDWEGAGSIPNWSEASILSDIGASRIDVSGGYQMGAAWLTQQYNIIDRLRWVQGTTGYNGGFRDSSPDEAAWVDAVANFAAASWSSYNDPAQHAAALSGGFYRANRVYQVATIPASSYDRTYDVYVTFKAYNSDTYENPDYPMAVEGERYKISTTGTPSGGVVNIDIGKFDTVTLSEPAVSGTDYGWSVHGPAEYIAKFDVTGGFTYVS